MGNLITAYALTMNTRKKELQQKNSQSKINKQYNTQKKDNNHICVPISRNSTIINNN